MTAGCCDSFELFTLWFLPVVPTASALPIAEHFARCWVSGLERAVLFDSVGMEGHGWFNYDPGCGYGLTNSWPLIIRDWILDASLHPKHRFPA